MALKVSFSLQILQILLVMIFGVISVPQVTSITLKALDLGICQKRALSNVTLKASGNIEQ